MIIGFSHSLQESNWPAILADRISTRGWQLAEAMRLFSKLPSDENKTIIRVLDVARDYEIGRAHV